MHSRKQTFVEPVRDIIELLSEAGTWALHQRPSVMLQVTKLGIRIYVSNNLQTYLVENEKLVGWLEIDKAPPSTNPIINMGEIAVQQFNDKLKNS